MKKLLCVFAVFGGILFSVPAVAAPFSEYVANDTYSGVNNGIPTAWDHTKSNDPNYGRPDIYQAVNEILGTTYAGNADVDPIFVAGDSLWRNLTGVTTVIGYSAFNSNTLGVYGTGFQYDVTGAYSGQGFDNVSDGVFDTYENEALGIDLDDDTAFGWYLRSSSRTFYSQSHLNEDGYDHMMTFDLGGPMEFWNGEEWVDFENPYLIAWEDQPYAWKESKGAYKLGDEDYNDFLYLIDAVINTPVPEPGTILLLGIGLLGLAGAGRRRPKS